MKLAQRMSRLGTETAFEVLAKAQQLEAQGKHIIHLEIGEPILKPPRILLKPVGRHYLMDLLPITPPLGTTI